MNTVVLRNGNTRQQGRRRRNRRRRQRRAAARRGAVNQIWVPKGTQQPVIVATQPRRRRRRNRRRGGRGNLVPAGSSGRGTSESFRFVISDLKGDSKGKIDFGPSLSQSAAFSGGILKSYELYKISRVVFSFVSEASSTAEGSIAFELDPGCSKSSVGTKLRRFSITNHSAQSVTFSGAEINGSNFISPDKDQFRFLYEGSGKANTAAGYILVHFMSHFIGPK
ncbi:P3/CP [Mallotus japonicus virus A]|nr:P3/CP [Mallotus japonicus virus A]